MSIRSHYTCTDQTDSNALHLFSPPELRFDYLLILKCFNGSWEFLGKFYPEKLILSLDQGTTNSKVLVFTHAGTIVSSATHELQQQYPSAGWVEQDPNKIWESILLSARGALSKVKSPILSAVAITNQRETTILWDKRTLEPAAPAIVWQDRRSSGICEELLKRGYGDLVRERTGLVIDPYFSATKIMWLLEKYPKLRRKAKAGQISFGTVDSFLLARLTNGRVHATDLTNASRTMLFDTKKLCWDEELLKLLKIPSKILPKVRPSSCFFGETDPKYFGRKLPIAAMIGDQQASLFGQAVFKPKMAKNTYGTGCFLLSTTGGQRIIDPNGKLLSTIAWGLDSGVTYALEGSALAAGSVLQWLKKGLKIVERSAELSRLSIGLGVNDDVYFVPALSGLGAPFWDARARGLIIGITSGTTRQHLVKAGLEAICYQSRDVLLALEETTGDRIDVLRVDGGASANNLLMQFQSDVIGKKVQRPEITETTALGAALLAGFTVGAWRNLGQIEKCWKLGKEFLPKMDPLERESLYGRWKDAVGRSRNWAK